MRAIRLAIPLLAVVSLSACGSRPHADSRGSTSRPSQPRAMYVPEGMKGQQYAIRLGDSIRRKLGGGTVAAGRGASASPSMALRDSARDPVLARRIREAAAARPAAGTGLSSMRIGGDGAAR